MDKTITSEIVVAYAQCPRKAYLLLHSDEVGKSNEYVVILKHQKSISQNSYLDNLRRQYADVRPYNDGNLRSESSFLINGILQGKACEAACGILTKVLSPSFLGEHSYEPTIFVGTHQINGDQKLELAFIGYILGQIQGKLPAIGKIISLGLKSHEAPIQI